MKRISLLLVLAVMVFGSADAFACRHCRIVTDECVFLNCCAASCDFSSGFCDEVGDCPPLASSERSLATQYTIASVERLDGQRSITVAQAPRIAAKSTPKR